jgi:hypothetical protein
MPTELRIANWTIVRVHDHKGRSLKAQFRYTIFYSNLGGSYETINPVRH